MDKKYNEGDPWVVNTDELARAFYTSKRWVHQLVKNGMPKLGRGKFDLIACFQWRLEQFENKTESSEMSRAKLNEIAARTRKHELEVLERQGHIIRIADAKQLVDALASQTAVEIEGIAGRINVDNETKGVISVECRNAAERLATFATKQAASLRNRGQFSGDTETAA